MKPRSKVRFALVAVALATAACSSYDSVQKLKNHLLGTSSTTVLTIQSITIRSDHPVDPNDPGGDAVVTTAGTVVKLTAIGTFSINGTATTATNDVTSGVVWQSSDPTFLFPGADGRVVVESTGTVTFSAVTPSIGSLPSFSSNSIVLHASF